MTSRLPRQSVGPSSATQTHALVLVSSLAAGGAERLVVGLVARLAERGRPVTLCTLSAKHDSPLATEVSRAGVRRCDLGARRLLDPRALLRYLDLARRTRIDVVHAHGQDAWILAGFARRFVRAPLVVTRHVLDEPTGTWRQLARRRLALAVARRADLVAAPSRATAERLAQLAGIPAGRIRLLPNGVDLRRFDPPTLDRRREPVRASLGWAAGECIALLPAVLRHGKGHDVLLAALPRLQGSVPDIRVVFAGDGERNQELKEAASQHGARVHFLGHRDDMAELLAASDVVVLPSDSEAQPIALMEAAAAGRPIVATRVGGIPDVVEHGATGLLVAPGDPHALADAIEAIVTDPVLAAAFGRAGRAIACSRFSIDTTVDETVALWAEAVAASRRVAA